MIRPLIIAALFASPAIAQEPEMLEGRIGCVLSWNYPAELEKHVAAFPILIDGQWRKGVPPTGRSVPCDDVGMSSAGTYHLELFARAKPESGFSNSRKVAFTVVLAAPKIPATAPDEIKLTMPGAKP
jgi:hypothetical protein